MMMTKTKQTTSNEPTNQTQSSNPQPRSRPRTQRTASSQATGTPQTTTYHMCRSHEARKPTHKAYRPQRLHQSSNTDTLTFSTKLCSLQVDPRAQRIGLKLERRTPCQPGAPFARRHGSAGVPFPVGARGRPVVCILHVFPHHGARLHGVEGALGIVPGGACHC